MRSREVRLGVADVGARPEGSGGDGHSVRHREEQGVGDPGSAHYEFTEGAVATGLAGPREIPDDTVTEADLARRDSGRADAIVARRIADTRCSSSAPAAAVGVLGARHPEPER